MVLNTSKLNTHWVKFCCFCPLSIEVSWLALFVYAAFPHVQPADGPFSLCFHKISPCVSQMTKCSGLSPANLSQRYRIMGIMRAPSCMPSMAHCSWPTNEIHMWPVASSEEWMDLLQILGHLSSALEVLCFSGWVTNRFHEFKQYISIHFLVKGI